MDQLTPIIAIKKFIEHGGEKLTTKELMEFKASCTPEQLLAYGKDAAAALGAECVPSKA